MIYSLLILAHVLADFPFQSQKTSDNKQIRFSYLLKHLLIVFLTTFILTAYYFSRSLLAFLLIITLVHGLIDFVKIALSKKYKIDDEDISAGNNYGSDHNLELFIVDQLLHILTIFIMVPLFSFQASSAVLFVLGKISSLYPYLSVINDRRITLVALAAAVIIFNFKGSTIIVRDTLKKYDSNYNGPGDRGKAIGNLERLLVVLFVILNNYSLIGLLFTAKSLIRFKEIEVKSIEDGFVEYYLLGSFISIFMAVLTGSLINMFKYLG